ncbi:hypothetical protein [Caballeronia grimmiae]|uniref:hypothetical protein n=1 Tax=Caballeronia grimmiae TaxID=1071679 RepID=UPI0038BBFD05
MDGGQYGSLVDVASGLKHFEYDRKASPDVFWTQQLAVAIISGLVVQMPLVLLLLPVLLQVLMRERSSQREKSQSGLSRGKSGA